MEFRRVLFRLGAAFCGFGLLYDRPCISGKFFVLHQLWLRQHFCRAQIAALHGKIWWGLMCYAVRIEVCTTRPLCYRSPEPTRSETRWCPTFPDKPLQKALFVH